jgi:hypothetical protein
MQSGKLRGSVGLIFEGELNTEWEREFAMMDGWLDGEIREQGC